MITTLEIIILLGILGFLVIWFIYHHVIYYGHPPTKYDDPNTRRDAPVDGVLPRRIKLGQYYVIDPADGSETWVNDTDDMYEDASGKVWKLI